MARGRGSGPQWEHADDIPLDDQDEFLQNRDHIALGSGSKSRSRPDLLDEDDNAHEVFRLQHSDEEDYEEDDEEDDDEEMEDSVPSAPVRSKQKRKQPAAASAEDDESDSDSDTSVADRAHFGRSKRSYYASTNALDSASEAGSDGATTDEEKELSPEQRRQMELREVRKMAVTARKGMVERDFGLEDSAELALASGASISGGAGRDGKSAEQLARERRRAALLGKQASDATSAGDSASNVHVSLPTDPTIVAAMLRDLHAKDALTLALAGEYADTMHEWTVLEQGMTKAAEELPADHPSFSLMHIYQQTFLTYLTTLTFYFYLRTSPTFSPSPTNPELAEGQLRNLRAHPVIGRLTELKEALSNMEDLGFRVDQAEASDVEDEVDDLPPIFRDEAGDYSAELGDLEDGELEDLLADEKENQALTILEDPPSVSDDLPGPSQPTAKPKTKKTKQASGSTSAATRGPLAELEELVTTSAPSPAATTKRKTAPISTVPDAEAAEALGELTSLTAAEKAEKQARKRSLRFYTGQIASRDANAPSSSKNSGNSRASALSGDADIPYTDRDRSRKAVEAAAEAKRARVAAEANGNASVDLDDSEAWGEEDAKAWRAIMGDGELPSSSKAGLSQLGSDLLEGNGAEQDDAADYYDLVASASHQRKKAKKDAYDEARLEERYQPDDTLAEGEHRGLNRTIEKNRGLTPHRPKAVRNPRVKKRIKYESAKKKLSSSRPVYKGGQSSLEGGYGGEKSGISEGIVRSRSFS